MVDFTPRIDVDTENRVGYLLLTGKKVFATLQVGETLIDIDRKQRPVGVEILNIDTTVPYSQITRIFSAYPDIMEVLEHAIKKSGLSYE